jgi:RHS repeat-associated protein
VRQKFGSKERDPETNLDFFGARYFASVQGRFTSPDSFFGRKTNPQTLNLYAYVLNNPLKWADPTGHFAQDPNKDDIDDCKCKFQIPVEKPGGFFSRIWGGLKKIGSAIGGAVKNAGSGIANHYRETAERAPFQRPIFTPIDRNATPTVLLAGIPEFEALAASRAAAGEVAEEAAIVEDVLAESGIRVFRGGPSLQARDIDIKIDKQTGLVQPGRGVSVNADPAGLERFGGAYRIEMDTVPPELEVIQHGTKDPGHYEIVPRQPMAPARYQELLDKVKLTPVKPPSQ